jgi:hypothetical protein
LKDQIRLIKEATYEEVCISYRYSSVTWPGGQPFCEPGIGLFLWWLWQEELWKRLRNGLWVWRLRSHVLRSGLLRPHVLRARVLSSSLRSHVWRESDEEGQEGKIQEDEIGLVRKNLLHERLRFGWHFFKGMISSRKAALQCNSGRTGKFRGWNVGVRRKLGADSEPINYQMFL